MNRGAKTILLILLLTLIAPTPAPTAPAKAEPSLLLVRQHFGATWYFYSDRVVVQYQGQNLTISSSLSRKIVNTTLVSSNSTHVVLATQLKVGAHTFNVTHVWRFSPAMPAAKLSTTISIDSFVPPGLLAKAFQYVVVFPDQPSRHGGREEWRGRHYFFSAEDMRRSGVKHGCTSKGNVIVVDVDLEGYGITIDPTVGYTSGEYSVSAVAKYVKRVHVSNAIYTGGGSATYTDTIPAHNGSTVKLEAWFSNAGIGTGNISIYVYNYTAAAYQLVKSATDILSGTVVSWSATMTGSYYSTLTSNDTLTAKFYYEYSNFADTDRRLTETLAQAEANVSYTAYSDANATYTYNVAAVQGGINTTGYSYTLYIPVGYELTGNSTDYSLADYNTTHGSLSFTMPASGAVFNFTAWNSLQLEANATYLPYGAPLQANVTLLDPYLNPISGNVTVWLGASYKTPNTTLTLLNATIGPGDTLAPHLYDWSLDGVDDYVEVPLNSILNRDTGDPLTIEVLASTVSTSLARQHILAFGRTASEGKCNYALRYYYDGADWHIDFYYRNSADTGWDVWRSDPVPLRLGEYNHIALSYVFGDPDSIVLVFNGVAYGGSWVLGTGAEAPYLTGQPLRLGMIYEGVGVPVGEPLNGLIALARIYNRTLTDINDSIKHIVNASGLVLFLDPTFWNGSAYIDLSGNNNNGIPYGVARVPANETWLWLVKSLKNDGYVHLAWFPLGSIVRFLDPATGSVVREVYIASNDEAVDLPPGNYTLEAVIPGRVGNYTSTTLTTNSNGNAATVFSTVNYDAEITVQAEYNGTYVGVDTVTVYSTGIVASLDYAYAYRNTSASIQLTAKHTVDGSPVNGYAYFKQSPLDIIPSVVEVRGGYADIPVDTGASGIYSLTLTSVHDGEYNYTLNRQYKYVVMGVNIDITVSPYRYFYMYNTTVQYNVRIYYDTGQTKAFNTTITVYRDGESSTRYELGDTFNGTVQVGFKTVISVSVVEADNSTITTREVTLYSLDLHATATRYDTDKGTLIYYNASTSRGILGDLAITLYMESGVWAASGVANSYGFQIYLHDYNKTENTVMFSFVLTNYEPATRTYNVSVSLWPKYYNDVYTVGFVLTVGGYQYDQYVATVNLTDTFIGKIVEMSITINGSTFSYTTGLVPGYGLYKYIYVDHQTVLASTHSGYALFPSATGTTLMVVANGLGIYTDPIQLAGNLYMPVKIVANTERIYESGETVDINVSVGIRGLLEVYVDGSPAYTSEVEPGNITLTIVVPEKPSQVLSDVVIEAVLTAGEFKDMDTVKLSVFNTPPTIQLISPPEMSTINGTVNITIYVFDTSGVKQVLWRWDFEEDYKLADVVDGYVTITFDTRRIPNGLVRLEVKAVDRQGYSSTESFAFYISNPQLEASFWITLKEKFGWFLRYVQASAIVTGLILFGITSVITYGIYKVRKGRQQQVIVVVEKEKARVRRK